MHLKTYNLQFNIKYLKVIKIRAQRWRKSKINKENKLSKPLMETIQLLINRKRHKNNFKARRKNQLKCHFWIILSIQVSTFVKAIVKIDHWKVKEIFKIQPKHLPQRTLRRLESNKIILIHYRKCNIIKIILLPRARYPNQVCSKRCHFQKL